MKNLLSTLAMLALGLLFGCMENSLPYDQPETATSMWNSNTTLETAQTLEDGTLLPPGTKLSFSVEQNARMRIELPQGFKFLVQKPDLSYELTTLTQYKCSCSKTGSCKVTYSPSSGDVGCAQSTCKGTCTGSYVGGGNEERTLGVLNMNNEEIDPEAPNFRASLSTEGLEGFFSLPEVREKIKFHYEFFYESYPEPDFEAIGNGYVPEGYRMVEVHLYGQPFSMVVPADPSLKEFFPNLTYLGDEVTCSGNCTNGCEVKKDCILTFCVYSCTGCQTCIMDIPEQ